MKKILVADDEAHIRRLVCDFLKNAGYETVEAVDGADAVKKFEECGNIDLAVVDIMMPEIDGWEVCRIIRKACAIPVLILTARSQEFDELTAFEAGADDYVTKPFSPSILVKRIEALLKRAESGALHNGEILTCGGVTIDIPAHVVKLDGESIDLTIKEYNILLKLMQNTGRIFTREQLLDDIWGVDYVGDPRTVDSHVARLRTKLGAWGDANLKTVYGMGYKIEV